MCLGEGGGGDKTHPCIIPVGRWISILIASLAPSTTGLGTATTTAAECGASVLAECGASALAGVDRRTLGRNLSPPLVRTMFGGGVDREWEDDNGTKGEECAG